MTELYIGIIWKHALNIEHVQWIVNLGNTCYSYLTVNLQIVNMQYANSVKLFYFEVKIVILLVEVYLLLV